MAVIPNEVRNLGWGKCLSQIRHFVRNDILYVHSLFNMDTQMKVAQKRYNRRHASSKVLLEPAMMVSASSPGMGLTSKLRTRRLLVDR